MANDGPGDASVLRPVLTSRRGIVVSCGMNPCYGEFDTYWMAASAIDEAVRNCVAVGADPNRIAILDNFCWGTTDRPETLGSLVRAALACYDMAIALGTPFISGKDSLNNEFRPLGAKEPIAIPPSLLISALGQMNDVSHSVSMDLKEPGNLLYIVGVTKNELGGSHYAIVENLSGGDVPKVDAVQAKATFLALHRAIYQGLIRACHDLSEGGLAVAAAEMAFAGGLGAKITTAALPCPACEKDSGSALSPTALLFSESNTRFLCEVQPQNAAAFESALAGIPHSRIGEVTKSNCLEIVGETTLVQADLAALKEAWQKPLRWQKTAATVGRKPTRNVVRVPMSHHRATKDIQQHPAKKQTIKNRGDVEEKKPPNIAMCQHGSAERRGRRASTTAAWNRSPTEENRERPALRIAKPAEPRLCSIRSALCKDNEKVGWPTLQRSAVLAADLTATQIAIAGI